MTGAATLLITGRIATLAGADGPGWVEALAVGDGHVLAAGRLAEVEDVVGRATRRLALDETDVVLPALTDAHLHLADAARMARQLDLDGLDMERAMARVAGEHRRRNAAGDGAGWLVGRGWSIDALGRWPRAAELDRVAPGRPVALWSHDLHSRWLSSAALAAAGLLAAGMADPPGGAIERDAAGQPTGLLREHAAGLVDRAIPAPDEADLAVALAAYSARLAALGVVGCHDPGELAPDPSMARGPRLYGRLAAAGRLPLRVHASIRADQLEVAIGLGLRTGAPLGEGSGAISQRGATARVGWLKLFADGALGSRTAALLAPYADGAGRGRLLLDRAGLAGLVVRAAAAGIEPQVHAIGDRAVRVALDALEAALATPAAPAAGAPASREDASWARLEHVQLARGADVARLGRLRVAASVQPGHLLHDAPIARTAWPRRLASAYRWRSLAAQGVPLAFGTDAPVESPDPWPGIAVAVTRRPDAARRPFPGAERLDLWRALRAAILDPAVVAGEAGVGGRLLAGHRADLVVVPADALRAPVTPGGALATCRPRLTLLGGAEVWRDPAFDR